MAGKTRFSVGVDCRREFLRGVSNGEGEVFSKLLSECTESSESTSQFADVSLNVSPRSLIAVHRHPRCQR